MTPRCRSSLFWVVSKRTVNVPTMTLDLPLVNLLSGLYEITRCDFMNGGYYLFWTKAR